MMVQYNNERISFRLAMLVLHDSAPGARSSTRLRHRRTSPVRATIGGCCICCRRHYQFSAEDRTFCPVLQLFWLLCDPTLLLRVLGLYATSGQFVIINEHSHTIRDSIW